MLPVSGQVERARCNNKVRILTGNIMSPSSDISGWQLPDTAGGNRTAVEILLGRTLNGTTQAEEGGLGHRSVGSSLCSVSTAHPSFL